jgi:hypothetical protein
MNPRIKLKIRQMGPRVAAITFVLMQIGLIGVCAYFWHHLPPPGWSIAIVAFVAAAMTIHPDIKAWHKALWMVLIGALLVLEFKSIRKDRADTEERFASILTNQNKTFQATSDGLQAAINNITGGTSFVYLPYFGLGSMKVGKEPLYAVSAHLELTRLPATVIPGYDTLASADYDFGDYPASESAFPLSQGHTNSDPETIAKLFGNPGQPVQLTIHFKARNGEWTEIFISAPSDPHAAVRGTEQALWVFRDTPAGRRLLLQKNTRYMSNDVIERFGPKF